MTEFAGRKALVVEDEGGVAVLIEDMLADLGCEIVASVASLEKALAAARVAAVDFAILDVNLGGERSFPVARILRERDIPFLFSTGYGAAGIVQEFSGSPTLNKPFSAAGLRIALRRLLVPRGGIV